MPSPRLSSVGIATSFAMLLAVGPRKAMGDRVCQVYTDEGQPLQEILGLRCEVNETSQTCNCSNPLLGDGQWHVITKAINQSMTKHPAKPGEWLVLDLSSRCVASFDGKVLLVPKPCPPGFYCKGDYSPPLTCSNGDHCIGGQRDKNRRCDAGYYCPFPAAPKVRCPDGGWCPVGKTEPLPCNAGSYCRNGTVRKCPHGFYCPVGAQEPRLCRALAFCPDGSKSEDVRILCVFGLVLFGFVTYAGGRYYSWVVKRSVWPIFICVGGITLMWFIEPVIAGFLTIMSTCIVTNWALLQRYCLPASITVLISRILVLVTVGAALAALWELSPPWAVMIGGIFWVAMTWWLMSRQSFACVLLGRAILVFSFGLLITAYFQVDSTFALCTLCFLVLTAVVMLAFWVWEQRRQKRRLKLPFLTRWRFASGTLNSFIMLDTEVSISQGGDLQRRLQSNRHQAITDPLNNAATTSNACPAGNARQRLPDEALQAENTKVSALRAPPGISFDLQDVSFDLPSGSRLLKSISLSIMPGKRAAVMGPSGSGKSTLLAVLSGRASYGHVAGRLLVNGQPSDDLRLLRPVTGFVPQDDVLHGELTVEENIRFQAALRLPVGTPFKDVARHVDEFGEVLNLTSIMQATVGTPERRGVSGGQRKRVSIAMELVSKPLLLFADEPTSGLDSTTSHEVVRCLNDAAESLGTTVIAVIHQPRYETLKLFDDLVLLTDGSLVYAGGTTDAVRYFTYKLEVEFPPDTNPADIMLDVIQPPHQIADVCVQAWKTECSSRIPQVACRACDFESRSRETHKFEHTCHLHEVCPLYLFSRERPPFIRAVLIYTDRSLRQAIRALVTILISQALNIAATTILCTVLQYEQLDQFMMQSSFACLCLMLLQGVAAQRIFGNDLLMTWREARVGMPMVAYFVAKDLAALFEVTVSSIVFTAAYGSFSGCQLPLQTLFGGTWAFVYSVFGLNYIFSIVLSPGAAQMSAVVSSFVAYCVSGVYQPQLPEVAAYVGSRGWMVPALSPVRWLWAYLLTAEARFLTPVTRVLMGDALKFKGYDLHFVRCPDVGDMTLRDAWLHRRCWVCSVAPMLLLGVLFRFLAGVCLIISVNAQTSGWARFLGQSDVGAWKLFGKLFALLVGTFMGLFLFSEVWVFSVLKFESGQTIPLPIWNTSLGDHAALLTV